MINPGYNISTKDASKLRDFKYSKAYSTYLNGIAKSPAYATIMHNHLKDINITEDIKKLKEEGLIPAGFSAEDVNNLFNKTLNKMAIGIVADAIILREIEEIKVDNVVSELKKDSDVMYLLGKADVSYYKEASRLLQENKLDKDSIGFRGLMAYTKQNPNNTGLDRDIIDDDVADDFNINEPNSTSSTSGSIDLDSTEMNL